MHSTKMYFSTEWLLIGISLISLYTIGAYANIDCEELPVEDCAFAVSSSGARCVLEKYRTKSGSPLYECQTSTIMAEKAEEWIESDECMRSCGVDRMSVGLSTDGFLEHNFAGQFCSEGCQKNCPNIIDLFTKLAAGEGLYLPHVCNDVRPRGSIKEHQPSNHFSRFLVEDVAPPVEGPIL
ncbi:hypothetical protein O6H91_06G053600 [Diphasiastrum complanatum]|uniref:Uncharacterized protein n=1 Tax=Diphasiastrum complanatum TaxID=34168 RepID=A0ACC2DDP9_DIPCM|nr:hypothetical protein O6H91_06G053600 [Diphasiastrum complanatum]